MSIKVITLKDSFFSNTYIIGDEKDVIVVDPSCGFDKIKQAINNRNLQAVFLTHGHFDHFKTLNDVLTRYGVTCYLHKEAYLKLLNPRASYAQLFRSYDDTSIEKEQCYFLSDKQVITLNSLKVKVLFTPGHTNCSVIYLINDLMFSGDTIFKGTVGRTDLLTGNHHQLLTSLKQIASLNKGFIVYPGHEEATILDDEIENNPYLKNLNL